MNNKLDIFLGILGIGILFGMWYITSDGFSYSRLSNKNIETAQLLYQSNEFDEACLYARVALTEAAESHNVDLLNTIKLERDRICGKKDELDQAAKHKVGIEK
jgi:hypothetical protein